MAESIIAATPVTTGAASDVPVAKPYMPPLLLLNSSVSEHGTSISVPGAEISHHEPYVELLFRLSEESVLITEITLL